MPEINPRTDTFAARIDAFEREILHRGNLDFSRFLPPEGDRRRADVLAELLQVVLRHLRHPERETAVATLRNQWPEIKEASWHQILSNNHLTGPPAQKLPRQASPESEDEATLTDVTAEITRHLPEMAHRFELRRKLGSGAMGTVLEAWDRERSERVAVKVFQGADPDLLLLFKREFRFIADLVHPNLVPLYEFFHKESLACFTMELIDGAELMTHISGSRDPIVRLRELLPQIAEGLHALHAVGRLHRDIKPSNILVTDRDRRVVILDFGLVTQLPRYRSVLVDDPLDSRLGGTLPYMAPEQMTGVALDVSCDWYAVGIILYRALTGDYPFHGSFDDVLEQKTLELSGDPLAALQDAPADLADLCRALLNPAPAARAGHSEILSVCQNESTSLTSDPDSEIRDATFLGREKEIKVLHDAFAATRASGFVAVLAHGHSGVGKTLLAEHFASQLQDTNDILLLWGRCYEQESIPYKGVDDVIDQLSACLATMSDDAVAEIVPEDAAALAVVFPVLTRVKRIRDSARRTVDLPDPREFRRRAFAVLQEIFVRLSERRPVLIVIDDLQWCDADSVAVIDSLIAGLEGRPVMLLACYRRELESQVSLRRFKDALLEREAATVELPVNPLAHAEAVALANELLQKYGTWTSAQAETIAQTADGNPFLIHELASTGSTLPQGSRLDDLLKARFSQLSEGGKDLLEIVSVASRPLRRCDAVEAACIQGEHHKIEGYLRSTHLIKSSGPGWRDKIETYHDRIRESTLASLDAPTLQRHHGALAKTLEQNPTADREGLAIHFLGAGNERKAGRYYAQAADEAGRALAFDRAAELYRRSLEHRPLRGSPLAELRLNLADCLANAGRGAEAAPEYLQAAALSEDGSAEKTELNRLAAYQYLISGHFDRGRAAIADVLETVGMKLQRSPALAVVSLLAHTLWLRVRGLRYRKDRNHRAIQTLKRRIDVCWAAGIGLGIIDIFRAADFHIRGLLLALFSGDEPRIVRSLALHAIHNSAEGSRVTEQTKKLLSVTQQVARNVDEPYANAILKLSQSGVALLEARYREGFEIGMEAETLFRTRCKGAAWEVDTAHIYQTWSLLSLGEVKRLRELCPTILENARKRGDKFELTMMNVYIQPHLLIYDDRPKEALDLQREALNQWSRQGFLAQHAFGMISGAEALLYDDDPEAALQSLEKNWGKYRRSQLIRIQYGFVVTHFLRGRCALAAAFANGTSRLLDQARRDARRLRKETRPGARARSAVIEAGLQARAGSISKALVSLKAAAHEFDATSMELHANACRLRIPLLSGTLEDTAAAARASAWMGSQRIVNPDRLSRCLVPLPSSTQMPGFS